MCAGGQPARGDDYVAGEALVMLQLHRGCVGAVQEG